MSTLFRYLASLMVHLAWRRAGRGGPIPPMRLPGKAGKIVDLPVIGTWQLMAAMWLLQKFWGRYGATLKARFTNNANDLARRAATFLPDINGAKPATSSATNLNVTPPATVTPQNNVAPNLTPRAHPNLKTQPLSSPNTSPHTPHNSGAASNLPSGSLLSKLRGRS